jgi:Zn ribbon nucleic-acid-binding protein
MEFIITLVLVLVVLQGFSAQRKEKNFSSGIKDCRFMKEPHKWSYNASDRLECLECGFVAGRPEIETDE